MADIKEVEVWIAMDSEGNLGVSDDREQAVDWCAEKGNGGPMSVVKITVSMRPPAETSAEAKVTVPDDAGEVIAASA